MTPANAPVAPLELGGRAVERAEASSGDVSAGLAAPAITVANPHGGRVRALEPGDLPAVAALFLKRFRPRTRGARVAPAIDDLVGYMREIYLEGPCSRIGPDSLVQVDQSGAVGGFLGLIKSTYLFEGAPLTACASSSLMAADDAAHRRVGPQLLRALNGSGFDLLLTDSANRTSFAFARPMKYEVLLLNSLDWSRPFKPAAMLVDIVGRRWPAAPATLLGPIARLADVAAGRLLRARRRRPRPRRWRQDMVDAAGFARIAPSFLDTYRLRPAWTARELDWLLARAAQQRSSGMLHFCVVRDRVEAPVGCFAFFGAPGRPATVLQTLACDGHWDNLVECLMQTTEDMGCLGVRGAGHPRIMPSLYGYPDLVFHHAGATMAFSRHAEVGRAIRADEALVGGLAGDRWTRLSKDEFGGVSRARGAVV